MTYISIKLLKKPNKIRVTHPLLYSLNPFIKRLCLFYPISQYVSNPLLSNCSATNCFTTTLILALPLTLSTGPTPLQLYSTILYWYSSLHSPLKSLQQPVTFWNYIYRSLPGIKLFTVVPPLSTRETFQDTQWMYETTNSTKPCIYYSVLSYTYIQIIKFYL